MPTKPAGGRTADPANSGFTATACSLVSTGMKAVPAKCRGGFRGARFDGTLVTDCYGGYHRHVARAKQECLVHLARSAREWKPLAVGAGDAAAVQFFDVVIAWGRRGCAFHRQRRDGKLSLVEEATENNYPWKSAVSP